MSDSDDTDALLTCDPGGGLSNLLEATGVSEDLVTSTAAASLVMDKQTEETASSQELNTSKDCTEKSVNVSDFFNSDGELILSGLSLASSDSEVSDKKEESSEESSGTTTEGTARPVDTVDATGRTLAEGNNTKGTTDLMLNEVQRKENENLRKSSIDDKDKDATSSSSSRRRDRRLKSVVPEEIQADLRNQILDANKGNAAVQKWLQTNQSQLTYGVLNLNLNDLQHFAEGLSKYNVFPPKQKVSTFVPTTNDKGEHIFTRAPNFRTPGGYKPPQNPKKCRDLTDEQILEEVRKMYAFPDIDDDDAEVTNGNSKEPSEAKNNVEKNLSDNCLKESVSNDEASKCSENSESNDISGKVQFDFLHGTDVPHEFGKGKTGKPIKRKLLPNQGNICGGSVGSIPDLGFGIRDMMLEEVKEPMIQKSTVWVTGTSFQEAVNSKELESNSSSVQGFSFGYGDEERSLSPIKPAVAQGQVNSNLLQSQRVQPSPEKAERVNHSASATPMMKETSHDFDLKRTALKEGAQPPDKPTGIFGEKGTEKKPSTPRRRLIRKAASKFRGMTSFRSPGDSFSAEVPMPTLASDLEKILSEIELPTEEMESLINGLDDDDIDATAARLLDDIDLDGNANFADALSHLKLDDWSNADNPKEKFHREKFKREQCEKELRLLQENVLAEKQQNAVLEGTLKRRNLMLVQITLAFNRICQEWKKYETVNKASINKLQHDQKLLVSACRHSRERISQYEKELHATIELADAFKSKLADVQLERDECVMGLKQANSELEEKILKLKEDMKTLQEERDATLRALRESQIKLDEGKSSLEIAENHVKALESKDLKNTKKYEQLVESKSQLDTDYAEMSARIRELESVIGKLTAQLSLEKSTMEKLKKDIREESDNKVRAEAERLHEYYNKKVQEILKTATEEAAKAESLLKDQIKRASHESDRKLTECKEQFQRELDALMNRYEMEIEKLKRENLHKQLLISSTVKQLQMGESPNLDANSHGSSSSRLYQKETFDNRHGSNVQDKDGSLYKSRSQISKFTLEHLPSAMSSRPQMKLSAESRNHNGLYTDAAYDVGLPRFKTSTPIDSHEHQITPNAAGHVSDMCKVTSMGVRTEDTTSNPYMDKVRSDKTSCSNSDTTDSRSSDLLSHLLETPVKPEKEQFRMNCLTGKLADSPLDPALQKCIQELLSCYSNKIHLDGRNGSGGSVSTLVPTNNNSKKDFSDNKKRETCNSQHDQIQCSAGLDDEDDVKTDHDKPKDKLHSNNTSSKGQGTSQIKPPWK